MDRRRRRAGRTAEHAAAAPEQGRIRGVITAPVLVEPATADAARKRGPSQDQYFSSLWSTAGQNREDSNQAKGHKGFPLPDKAPAVEGTFYIFTKSDKTGLELADLLLKCMYDNDCNEVCDKRREILHARASSHPDKEHVKALEKDLVILMANLRKKAREILTCTGYDAYVPRHFQNYPALDK